jgi:endonuclease/exonuclease/phosphatase family metal-dependent hydrolase
LLLCRAALLSQLAITGARVWRLPRPAADVRTLLCVGIRVGREIKVCSTHITPHDANKGPQIQAVARATAFGPGVPVVLMGDFNVTPGEDYLDDVYSGPHGGGARGRFEEADATAGDGSPCRCGEATFDRPFTDPKIDYVFVTAAHWGAVHADATYSGYSDHDPVRGSAVLEE